MHEKSLDAVGSSGSRVGDIKNAEGTRLGRNGKASKECMHRLPVLEFEEGNNSCRSRLTQSSPNSGQPASGTGQHTHYAANPSQRSVLRAGEWRQIAAAGILRKWMLYADEPLEQGRGAVPNVCSPPTGRYRDRMKALSLDSATVKVHPNNTGVLKKTSRKLSGKVGTGVSSRFIGLPQMNAVRQGSLSRKQASDGPRGCTLIADCAVPAPAGC